MINTQTVQTSGDIILANELGSCALYPVIAGCSILLITYTFNYFLGYDKEISMIAQNEQDEQKIEILGKLTEKSHELEERGIDLILEIHDRLNGFDPSKVHTEWVANHLKWKFNMTLDELYLVTYFWDYDILVAFEEKLSEGLIYAGSPDLIYLLNEFGNVGFNCIISLCNLDPALLIFIESLNNFI